LHEIKQVGEIAVDEFAVGEIYVDESPLHQNHSQPIEQHILDTYAGKQLF
jgi:hypothetical protein